MSGELTVTITFKYEKSGTKVAETLSKTIDVSGTKILHQRQSIGTTQEALNLGESFATGGWVFGINRDPTNFVDFRSGTGATDFGRAKAGEPFAIRVSPDSTAPFAIADTAAVEIEFWMFSD